MLDKDKILSSDIDIILVGDRVHMSTNALNNIVIALSIGPELNGVHHEYRQDINKIISRMVKIANDKHQDQRYSLERLLVICAEESFVTKQVDGCITNMRPGTMEEVVGRWRNRGMVDARQRFCYFAKEYTRKSLKAIGSVIGDRDHTTIMHSVQAVRKLMDVDFDYRQETERIRKIIISED